MSCTEIETETLVSSTDAQEIEGEIRQRKTARMDDTLQLLSTNNSRQRRRCRRHSYAFCCGEHEKDQDGDEGKHYESVLLVRVMLSINGVY